MHDMFRGQYIKQLDWNEGLCERRVKKLGWKM